MKKIVYTLLATLLLVTGCDFLEPENKSNGASSAEYFGTSEGFESLVNSAYAALKEIYKGDPKLFCAGTDLYADGGHSIDIALHRYTSLIPSNAGVKDFYSKCYQGVESANCVLYYSDKTEITNTLPLRIAEARFLRGFFYYMLVQHFGDVAIMREYSNAVLEELPRDSKADVYNFIMDEWKDIIDNSELPEEDRTGRVSKQAVRHFLAKLYLVRGWDADCAQDDDFSNAAAYAEAAIAGKGLTIPFGELWSPENENNDEFIFSVQYDRNALIGSVGVTGGHSQQNYFCVSLKEPAEGHKGGAASYVATLRSIKLFGAHDTRWEGTFMNILYKYNGKDRPETGYYAYYRNNQPDTLRIEAYYPREFEASPDQIAAWRAVDPEKRNNTSVVPMTAITVRVFDGVSPISYEEAIRTDAYGGICVRKFDDPESVHGTGSSFRDIVLARLGETYLVAAEAYFKTNQLDKATEKINVVRRRAAEPGFELDVHANDITLDFILEERGRELFGEYHRWMDLKRTGKLIEYNELYNKDMAGSASDLMKGKDGQYKLLRPIPQDAIDLNKAEIKQNPGY